VLRDITDSDPGRGGRTARLVVIGVATAVIVATTLIAIQPRGRAAGPTPEPTPTPLARSAGLLGATFADSRHGWLLTGSGQFGATLWRTEDGGTRWTPAMKIPSATSVGAMRLGPDGRGSVATLSLPQGADPRGNGLWLTSDGGRSFEEHPFPNPAGYVLLGLSTPSDGSAHAFFSDEDYPPTGLVYERQPDAGGTWKQVGSLGPAPAREPLDSPLRQPIPIFGSATGFAFLDQARGVIAAQTDTAGLGVYRTSDAGRSWTYLKVGLPPNGGQLPPASVNISVFDGLLLLAVAFEAGTAQPATYLYLSSDGGATWAAPVGVPTEDGLEAPAFDGPSDWWIPYGSAVVVTASSGSRWLRTALNLPGATIVKAVFPVDQLRAWAFGGGAPGPPQFLFRTIDGGLTWTAVKPPG
jgi:photosystem II stability/assembly factor-like uncharacterized protein